MHHCWWKALFSYGFFSVCFKVSVTCTGLVPSLTWNSSHTPRWYLCMWEGGEEERPPSTSAEEQLRFYISPTATLLRIFCSNKQKKLQQNYSAFRLVLWSRESIKAYLQSHIIAPKYVWTITHVVSALLLWNSLYVLKYSSVLQGNVTHKHTQPRLQAISFVSSGWVLDLKCLKPALQNLKSKRPQNGFMPFPIHDFISRKLSN